MGSSDQRTRPVEPCLMTPMPGKVVTDSTWPLAVAQRSSVPPTPMPLTAISRFT